MFEKEERKLTEWKEQYDLIDIPLDKIDQAIESGYKNGKIANKQKKKIWIMPSIAAAIILISLLTTIRVSPTFAEYLSTVPGMEKIVELISNNKGLQAAIDNEYAQKIGISQKKNGMNMTIDSVISDDKGMVIFYSIEGVEKLSELQIEKVTLHTKSGDKIKYDTLSFGNPSDDQTKSYSDVLEFYFSDPLDSQELKLNVEVKNQGIMTDFSVPFTIKKQDHKSQVYEMNKTVSIENQNITVKKVTVDPLRVAVHVEMDPNNSKKLLEFQDIRLVDQNGEAWSKIANGITASKINDHEQMIYLQSNYFKTPKELYLVINKIQAVNKEDAFVIIDTEKKEIIQQPKGNKLSDLQVEGGNITLNLELEKEFNYHIFTSIEDSQGKDISSTGGVSYGYEDHAQSIGFTLDNRKYSNPIKLQLGFYPSWINGDVKMKLE
ncbi:DUF4179 domain-containing protein [Metabacillus litoralis]|uniref:DUF4179 domain-containing protein n=1 Tax=Metabacillus litoralis TaxID=152268 RepID=UPI001CFDE903|nr:DUF4179 domain-containing protein [Metabacillus litoralis]